MHGISQTNYLGTWDCRQLDSLAQFFAPNKVKTILWNHDVNNEHGWGLDFPLVCSLRFFQRSILPRNYDVPQVDVARSCVV